MGIEPTPSAWKAEVLPLNYTRELMVEGEGFEPSKAEPTDLQSVPVDRLGTPPKQSAHLTSSAKGVKLFFMENLALLLNLYFASNLPTRQVKGNQHSVPCRATVNAGIMRLNRQP